MYKEYVFLDEKGNNITNTAFLGIGDKVINANGEWVVEGIVNNNEITKTISVFNRVNIERNYIQQIILKRINKPE